MAFSDWDDYSINGGVHTPNLITPLEGVQSLQMDASGGGQRGIGVIPSDASGLTKNLIAGRMRTQMQNTAGLLSSGYRAGIFFMQDTDNVTPFTTVDVYAATVNGAGTVEILKTTSGLLFTSALATSSVGYISDVTTAFTLEVVWFYDIPEFNGTRIIVSTGTATDYSDLVPVPGLDIIDAVSPHSVGAALGLSVFTSSGASSTWLFDRTELYSVTFE